MPDAPEKTILVDGPMAGHLLPIPEDAISWMVRVPQRLTVAMLENPADWRDETVVYRTTQVTYTNGAGPRLAGVGWCGTDTQPRREDLFEHVPTGLAELGVIPWGEVLLLHLGRGETDRVLAEECGSPLKPCGITVRDADSWRDWLEASCACGWRTDRVALDQRSKLLRCAHGHALDEAARRERFHQPIRVLSEGSGPVDDCYGGLSFDEPSQSVFGVCRRCEWETERVEYVRTGPLRVLCQAHTGPDGVRRARDALLASFGLPSAEEAQDA